MYVVDEVTSVHDFSAFLFYIATVIGFPFNPLIFCYYEVKKLYSPLSLCFLFCCWVAIAPFSILSSYFTVSLGCFFKWSVFVCYTLYKVVFSGFYMFVVLLNCVFLYFFWYI